MRSSHSLDRLDMAFDDDRLVADAGLLLPATLAAHLGLEELVEEHVVRAAVANGTRRGVRDRIGRSSQPYCQLGSRCRAMISRASAWRPMA